MLMLVRNICVLVMDLFKRLQSVSRETSPAHRKKLSHGDERNADIIGVDSFIKITTNALR